MAHRSPALRDGDEVRDLLQLAGRQDVAGDELVQRRKRLLVAGRDDLLGGHRTDAGQGLELGLRGPVQVDQAAPAIPAITATGGPAPMIGTQICCPSTSSAARFRVWAAAARSADSA